MVFGYVVLVLSCILVGGRLLSYFLSAGAIAEVTFPLLVFCISRQYDVLSKAVPGFWCLHISAIPDVLIAIVSIPLVCIFTSVIGLVDH